MPAVPQAQGVAYQPGSYTPAFWHAFPTTYMLQPTEGYSLSAKSWRSP